MNLRSYRRILAVAGLGLAAAGCRMTTDPSCSVQRELCDERCLRCLYCPECTTDCFSNESWYRAPTLWSPRCARTRAGFERIRPLPEANEVFALPRAIETD